MRTLFHHQPEAQHPIFQLSTSWQADYPIFRAKADVGQRLRRNPSPVCAENLIRLDLMTESPNVRRDQGG